MRESPDAVPKAMVVRPNSAKSAELQIIIWFLEAGWELFTPVADSGTDLVVRHPLTQELLAIQVKHKQPAALNEGLLQNDWRGLQPPFDYLVFFVPERLRVLIIPSEKLRKQGKLFMFFAKDEDGYSRGKVRPIFSQYYLDLAQFPTEGRAEAFTAFFMNVHADKVFQLTC